MSEKNVGRRSTKILRCSCKHAFQDKKYGVGKRVHNRMGMMPDDVTSWRCTVCKSIRRV